MPIEGPDHVNLRTARVAEMTAWYEDILDMKKGWRPPFNIGGAWLYLGELPFVHLVEQASDPSGDDPKIEHFALRASGLADFLAKLRDRGIEYSVDEVPDYDRVQVNFFDPDGNHIHVDFPTAEYQAL